MSLDRDVDESPVKCISAKYPTEGRIRFTAARTSLWMWYRRANSS